MERVVRKAYAKINLGLDVLRRREDGYHEVKMIMQTVELYDVLTIEKTEGNEIVLTVGNAPLSAGADNLIYKAASLMKEHFHLQSGLKMELVKNIPIAAGMAGGSTDAAAVLNGMNELLELHADSEELEEIAVKIGADVPYCLRGGTVLCEGIGEIMTTLPDAPNCIVLIAKPDINVSTKYVYENLHLEELLTHPMIDTMHDAILTNDKITMIDTMENVLETVTGNAYPVIGDIEETMKKHGALNAIMSGSGPTVFGVFETMVQAAEAFDAVKEAGFAKEIYISHFVNPKEEER